MTDGEDGQSRPDDDHEDEDENHPMSPGENGRDEDEEDEDGLEKTDEPSTIVTDDHLAHDYHRRLMADHNRSPNRPAVQHDGSVESMQNVTLTSSPHVPSHETTPISVSSIHLNPHKHPRLSGLHPHEAIMNHAGFVHHEGLNRPIHESSPALGHGIHRLTHESDGRH